MTDGDDEGDERAVADRLRSLVWGRNDPRVRATYRVLLAWPVLWFVAGTLSVLIAGLVLHPGSGTGLRMSVGGLLQAGVFAVFLLGWARVLDRRRIEDYGLAVDAGWIADLLAGFGAVLVGSTVWLGLGTAMGWATVGVAATNPQGSLALGLVGVFVGVLANVWVQETVFFGVAATAGAEGLRARGVDPRQAVLAAWAVAVALFTVKHRPEAAPRMLNLIVVLGVYGLLYVHTGQLALSVGVHAGVNFAGQTLLADPAFAAEGPSLMHASTSLSGLSGSLSSGAVPHVLVAYLLLLGWIWVRRGGVSVTTELSEWVEH